MKAWLVMMSCVIVYLIILMSTCEAGWIYNVEGVMVPTLSNETAVSFSGELEFLDETVEEGFLRLNLTNETDPETDDPITREASFNLQSSLFDPIGVRTFAGDWDEQPFTMSWYNWEPAEVVDFSNYDLRDQGWDSMSIGFTDYPLGTITGLSNPREVPPVNEPQGLALLVVGFCAVAGFLRPRTSNQYPVTLH